MVCVAAVETGVEGGVVWGGGVLGGGQLLGTGGGGLGVWTEHEHAAVQAGAGDGRHVRRVARSSTAAGPVRGVQAWMVCSRVSRLCGNEQWKEEAASGSYDYELVQMRLEQLRVARESNDVGGLSFLVRASLSRSFGDMGRAELYGARSHVGTKRLI